MAQIGTLFPDGVKGKDRGALVKKYGQPSLDHVVATSVWSSKPVPIPNADEVLAKRSSDGVALYRQARMRVPFSSGLFKMRIDAAMGAKATWIAGDEADGQSRKYRDETDTAWDEVPYRDFAIRNLLFCIADGISFGEVVWKSIPIRLEGTDYLSLLPCLIDRYPEKFYFASDGQIWWRGNGRQRARAVSPLQVLVGRYGSASLYGCGDTRDIYADLWKWDKIDGWGLEALERQGFPLVEIIVPQALGDTYVGKYVSWARKTYKNFIVLKWGDKFEVRHPQKSVMVTYLGQDQIARLGALQDSISIGILSVAFSNGPEGSFARDAARSEIRYEKTPTDVQVRTNIAHAWRDRYAWANWGEGVPRGLLPRYTVDVEPNEDLKAWTDSMVQWVDRGFPLSTEQVAAKFGAVMAEEGEPSLVPVIYRRITQTQAQLDASTEGEGETLAGVVDVSGGSVAFADQDGAVHRISRTRMRELLGDGEAEN